MIQSAAMATVLAKPDSDRDGMPDDYELANGLNPSNPADALQDLDGDGFSTASLMTRARHPLTKNRDEHL